MPCCRAIVGDDDPVPALTDPVEPRLARALRREVLRYRRADDRQRTVVHVGAPDGPHVSFEPDRHEPLDVALRVEVVAALLARVRPELPPEIGAGIVWLARPGPAEWEDVDADWLAAALAAYAEVALPLTFVVVHRDGWLDPRSGTARTWKRLRDRRKPRPG